MPSSPSSHDVIAAVLAHDFLDEDEDQGALAADSVLEALQHAGFEIVKVAR